MSRALVFACLAFAVLATGSCGDKPDIYNITIPSLKASADESIVFLDVAVNAGTIQGVSNIPLGWEIRVDNDANWTSRLRASSTIGAANLGADELKRIVFNVRRNESENFKFDVNGSASLSKTFDKRKLPLTITDFNLGPSS